MYYVRDGNIRSKGTIRVDKIKVMCIGDEITDDDIKEASDWLDHKNGENAIPLEDILKKFNETNA